MIKMNKLPDDILARIDRLDTLFARDERVIFAYLFGGLAKGGAKPLSDLDLAVFLAPGVVTGEAKLELSGALADLLGTDEFDLVVLNTSPLSLVGRILEKRRVITDKQPFVRHTFESRSMREFFDFRRREEDILRQRFV